MASLLHKISRWEPSASDEQPEEIRLLVPICEQEHPRVVSINWKLNQIAHLQPGETHLPKVIFPLPDQRTLIVVCIVVVDVAHHEQGNFLRLTAHPTQNIG